MKLESLASQSTWPGLHPAASKLLRRIATNLEIFDGKPIIHGLRLSVELVLSLLAQGVPAEEILALNRR